MGGKLIKAVVTFPIFFAGVSKKPGDVIEGMEDEVNAIVGMDRATKEMAWKPAKSEKKGAAA